ncbi:ATP synthase F0 subcomplex A subunit [Winogradskyella epiphytica]|uniref:ATP synthase subunit a n=1 Tax=Winogradskyella epiphytica TaxID=262005 RepID=A0A2V4XMG5_9FLAO|nr:F0F1 ATP synthase subunit A [Winogradskyella epiphytica]PYE83269.1 ATP synthase F0 subcomplex A subunit [Winogradskyella epiphytica]GGW56967.1 ATP synthase subunit a [Winogradskyella epiphytica]
MKIVQQSFKCLALAILMFLPTSIFANNATQDGGQINTKEKVDAYIQHHIKDSHDFTFFSYTNDAGERKHVGFALPVIIWSSEGLVTFMSSEFHHNDDGTVVVEKDGLKFVKSHSKIYELEAGAKTVAFDEEHHVTNGKRLLDFSITKSVFGILLISALLFFWFFRLAKQYKKRQIPTGFGRILEPLVIYVRDEIAKPNIGDKHYRRFTGYLLTVFFFIWFLNLAGLTPLGFNVTGQLAVTACLALFTLVIYAVSGNKDFWQHILWMPGVPYLIRPVLAVIELVGTFVIKPFSLLIRLFANISAGHVIVMSLIAIMFVLKDSLGVAGATGLSFMLAVLIMFIEILVAFLQAYIFTMLSALFIGMAVAEHDHEHEHTASGLEIPDEEDIRGDFV